MGNVRGQLFFTPLLALCLSGCDQIYTRECKGFGDDPLVGVWAEEAIGSNLRFISEQFEQEVNLELESVMKSEAKTQQSIGVPRSKCFETADYSYKYGNSDTTVQFSFSTSISDSGFKDRSMTLNINTLIESQWSSSPLSFHLNELDYERNNLDGEIYFQQSRYYASRAVNGVDYLHVIEATRSTVNRENLNLPKNAITFERILIARDFGLLQYELSDGKVYNRVF